MKRTILLAALAATAGVAVLLLARSSTMPPPVLGQVPAFRLVADDGRPFEPSTPGRAWLASFLYTSCPGPCPRLVERLKTLRQQIPASKLAFVSFSVDPQTDTPEVLSAYRNKHGIRADDAWTFVTGPATDVLAVVQKGFLVGVESDDPAPGDGRVTHGVRVVLVDAKSRIRGFYSSDDDAELKRLAADVAALD